LNRQDTETAKQKEEKGANVSDLPDPSVSPRRTLGVLAVQSLRSDPATTPHSIMSLKPYRIAHQLTG